MDKQTSLFGEVVSDREITLQIEFRLKERENDITSIFYDGKAYPDVSSGGIFGGAFRCPTKDIDKEINDMCKHQAEWFSGCGYRIKTIKKSILKDGEDSSLDKIKIESGDDEE
jgi:hypothetical protein